MSIQTIALHNLPSQPTPFVGREADIVDIIGRLRDPNIRLLTLIGTGGIGKTRLAIELIHHLVKSDFEHGIFFVPLAPLTSADNILTTIINVLGIRVDNESSLQDELITFLQHRHLLLVIDNVEHVLDGVDLIADILSATDDVKILTTSREMLNLSMEHLWHVRGMDYPEHNDPDDINRYDALNLFIERAIQVWRDFAPGDEQVNIIRICQLVDGLPLGIELAAGWLKTLSPNDIIQQIEEGIDILSTRTRDVKPRHRSIRAVFDHSWQLLTVGEQAVFPRLSVFRGGFTLEAAEQVTNADLTILSGLIEKSMIRRDTNGRYDIHELLRQYGEEKLTEAKEYTTNHESHLIYFVHFIEQRLPDLMGRRQVEALDEIRADFDNIRVVWRYGCENLKYHHMDKMLEGIAVFFDINDYPPTATEIYDLALSQITDLSDPLQAKFENRLKILGYYASIRHNTIGIDTFSDELQICLKKAEKNQDQLSILYGFMINSLNRTFPEQELHMQRALELSEQFDTYYLRRVLNQICRYYVLELNSNDDTTRNYLQQYREVTQTTNDIFGLATANAMFGQFARYWGDIDDATNYYKKAMEIFQQLDIDPSFYINKNLYIFMSLKKGDFSYIVSNLPVGINALGSVGFFSKHTYMYMIMGKAEALLGNYNKGKTYAQLSKFGYRNVIQRDQFHIIEVEIICTIAENDYDAVRQYIMQALHIDTVIIATRLKLDFLPLAAFLYHHDQQFTEAVKLLGLVFTHPLATTEWMERWALLTKLRQTLEDALGASVYQSTWEQGAQLDVDKVIDNIRRYVGIESSDQPLLQPLIEPLTNRELDVLHLLGEGYTNSQIANELIIAIGTVKSHVHKICQKLGVTNRTQAVLEAKHLGLL